MMVQGVSSNRLRLSEVVVKDLAIDRFLVGYVVSSKEVIEVTMKLMGPVKGTFDFPDQTLERRSDEGFIRRQSRLAVDEGQNLQSRLLDHRVIIRVEQGLGQMGVT